MNGILGMGEVGRGLGDLMLLGADIGTTYIKACMYDERGRYLGGVHRRTPTRRLPDGGAEYDASAIERVVFEAIRQVSEQVGPPQAIGISSIGESGFLIDRAGEPLVPAIAWFDGRTAPQAARWKGRMDPLELFSRTGLRYAPLHSACKLEWLKENSPEAWKKAAGWLGVAEYLVFRMTGERNTDPSLASRTLLFRIDRAEWDEELCELAGVPPELLPPVRETGTGSGGLLASAAKEVSAPAGIPVVVCGHDHICGAFGAGATEPGEVVDSIGTAEACILTLHSPPLNEAVYDLNLLVGRHVVPGRFYLATTLPESGGSVDWMLRLLEGDEKDLYRWTDLAAELSPGEGGVFLPPLHGEDYRIALCALSKDGDPAHFLRAVLEGLTLEIDTTLKLAARATGIELKSLTLMGGGAKNALWRQLKADASSLSARRLGPRVRRPRRRHARRGQSRHLRGSRCGSCSEARATRPQTFRRTASLRTIVLRGLRATSQTARGCAFRVAESKAHTLAARCAPANQRGRSRELCWYQNPYALRWRRTGPGSVFVDGR